MRPIIHTIARALFHAGGLGLLSFWGAPLWLATLTLSPQTGRVEKQFHIEGRASLDSLFGAGEGPWQKHVDVEPRKTADRHSDHSLKLIAKSLGCKGLRVPFGSSNEVSPAGWCTSNPHRQNSDNSGDRRCDGVLVLLKRKLVNVDDLLR